MVAAGGLTRRVRHVVPAAWQDERRQASSKATTKEVIAFVVSAINGCDYCINAHRMGLQQQGLDDEAIAEALAVASLWEEINRFAIGARLHWKSWHDRGRQDHVPGYGADDGQGRP